MSNRINFLFKVVGGIAAILVFGFLINMVVSQMHDQVVAANVSLTPDSNVPVSSRPADRLLTFTMEKDGNLDVYTVRADGSNLTNLTNNPARDANPIWSPDGRRIAFESDRTGFTQIFLMDADGSNVVQVTDGDADHQFSDFDSWSPDGNRLLFIEKVLNEEKWLLYAINADGLYKTPLVQIPSVYVSPSWSPDGQHIAFIIIERPEGLPDHREVSRIRVVDANGNHTSDATRLLPLDEDLLSFSYSWSGNENISFLAGRYTRENENRRYAAYEASLDGNILVERTHTTMYLGDYWNDTSFIVGDGSSLMWLRSDGSNSTLLPQENCQSDHEMQWNMAYQRSYDGNLVIGGRCSNDKWWLYWANPDGTEVKQLLNYPVQGQAGPMNLAWSPDDKYIALSFTSAHTTSLYMLNVADALKDSSTPLVKVEVTGGSQYYSPSWQPIITGDVAEQMPTPEPKQTSQAFRFGAPVETKEQALIAASSGMKRNFNYVEPLVVATVNYGNYEEFIKWVGSSSPAPKQVWVVVYFNKEWKSTFIASSSAYNDQGLIVTIPPEMRTPPPPFRGCVVVVIDASNGSTVSVGGPLQQGLIPDCDKLVEQKPTSQPTQTSPDTGLIAFASENANDSSANRNTEIFTMRMDGSNVVNITNDPANDSSPVWSPDGKKVAFISDRKGNSDIFVMNPDGTDVTQLTDDPGYDGFFSWSPDGEKIVFSSSPGNDPNEGNRLFIMNKDGSDKFALMSELGSYIFHGWSPDSQKIIFAKQQPNPDIKVEDAGIYIMGVDGSEQIKLGVAYLEQIHWEDNNHFYGVVLDNTSYDHTLWSIDQFDVNGNTMGRIASHTAPGADTLGIFENTYIVQSNNALRWYSLDGSRATLATWDFDTKCNQPNEGPYAVPMISPDQNLAFVGIYCLDEAASFHLIDAEGSMIKQLTGVSIPDPRQIMGISWSSDGKYLLLTIASREGGFMDMYLLDIEQTLADPSSEPAKLTADNAWRYGYQAVLQPAPLK